VGEELDGLGPALVEALRAWTKSRWSYTVGTVSDVGAPSRNVSSPRRLVTLSGTPRAWITARYAFHCTLLRRSFVLQVTKPEWGKDVVKQMS
jgi:hypothetical protein